MGNKKKCVCCKVKELEYSGQKFCTSCSLYTKELRRILSYYKSKSRRLTKEKYGTYSGAERIR